MNRITALARSPAFPCGADTATRRFFSGGGAGAGAAAIAGGGADVVEIVTAGAGGAGVAISATGAGFLRQLDDGQADVLALLVFWQQIEIFLVMSRCFFL